MFVRLWSLRMRGNRALGRAPTGTAIVDSATCRSAPQRAISTTSVRPLLLLLNYPAGRCDSLIVLRNGLAQSIHVRCDAQSRFVRRLHVTRDPGGSSARILHADITVKIRGRKAQ